MAVTVLIRQAGDGELSLTLDAPRIVIGRGKSCDIQLPDPSVSPRHASIRLQGGKNLVIDEGSTNGVVVMTPGDHPSSLVRLPPQTPRALSGGDLIRIGRVWLEVSFSVGVPSTPADVRRVAAEVLRHALEDDGEPTVARLEQGGETVLELIDPEVEHVLGRAKDAQLVMRDELASRHHAVIVRDGSRWAIRDLGSKRGTRLGEEVVDRAGKALGDGATITIGATSLVFRDPLANALSAMQKAEDVKLPASALPAAPPGMPVASHTIEAPPEGIGADAGEAEMMDDDEEDDGPSALDRLAEEPTGAGFAAVDALVVLIALSVLGVSVLGLAYVLG